MNPEEVCARILAEVLPRIDPQRGGDFIEVGCGTFAYYFEIFAQLGFRTLAVEPLPAPNLRAACQRWRTPLEEACLADVDGHKTMFIGTFQNHENVNLSSLVEDWWGSSGRRVQVRSVTLASLLQRFGSRRITGFKVDVEGAEVIILRQLPGLAPELLPRMVMFEYGGGDERSSGAKGWQSKFVASTLECMAILRRCGYARALIADSVAGATMVELTAENCADPDRLFAMNSNYGNILVFHGAVALSAEELQSICARHTGGAPQ